MNIVMQAAGHFCKIMHRSAIVRQFLSKNQICMLDHSPYLPDLLGVGINS
jgi:hypothetical protein